MAYSFRIDIVTPEDNYFSGEVVSIMAPGLKAPFTVWLNHAPFVTPLRKGRIELHLVDRTKKFFAINGGFFEVAYNQAVLLVEKITPLES